MVKRSLVIVFAAKFFGFFALLYFLLVSFPPLFLQEWLAKAVSSILGLQSKGILIFVESGTFVMTESCTGLVSGIILASVVFSLRRPELKKKLLLFFAGALLLFAVNFARLLLVVSAGVYWGIAAAEILHAISWLAMSVAIILVWFLLTKRFAGIGRFNELL